MRVIHSRKFFDSTKFPFNQHLKLVVRLLKNSKDVILTTVTSLSYFSILFSHYILLLKTVRCESTLKHTYTWKKRPKQKCNFVPNNQEWVRTGHFYKLSLIKQPLNASMNTHVYCSLITNHQRPLKTFWFITNNVNVFSLFLSKSCLQKLI